MKAYLDASIIVALFTDDPNSAAAQALLRESNGICVLSDFASTEFASAVSKKVRSGELPKVHAADAFADFDTWAADVPERIDVSSGDLKVAATYLRRLDLALRASDAINIAMAFRHGCRLLTLDKRMAIDAANLGVAT